MFGNEFIRQDILHITGIEEGVMDVVDFGIHLSILNSLGYIFDTYDLACLLGHEVGNGTCASIQVVNQFFTSQSGKLSGNAVQMVCLLGVGLVETLRTNLEFQIFHRLKDMVVTLEYQYLLITDSVITLLVIKIH